jgi:hypothetical protein
MNAFTPQESIALTSDRSDTINIIYISRLMLKIFSIRKRDGERAVGTRDGHCNKGREVRLERGKRKGTEVVRN